MAGRAAGEEDCSHGNTINRTLYLLQQHRQKEQAGYLDEEFSFGTKLGEGGGSVALEENHEQKYVPLERYVLRRKYIPVASYS